MPRPRSPRIVSSRPVAPLFKPGGVPALSQVRMTLDEFEAIRLADLERALQITAAARMGVSRPTFGRILAAARRKVAEALVLGRALRIEGGSVEPAVARRGRCPFCAHRCCADSPDHCARCAEGLVRLERPSVLGRAS
jgi:predicted DNA-binding protein (UPF0251 family)